MEKIPIYEKVMSALFVIWFTVSVVILICFSGTDNTWITLSVSGQFFIIIGSAACINLHKERKLSRNGIIITVPVTGLIMVLYGVLSIWGDTGLDMFVPVTGAILLLCGILAGAGPIIDYQKRKKVCSEKISGTVKEVKIMEKRINRGKRKRVRMYCPVYEICLEGKRYSLCNMEFYDSPVPVKGKDTELYICPDNPENFMDGRGKGKCILNTVFAFFILATGIILLFAAR